jgi:Ni/Co efflux regulator RcnB
VAQARWTEERTLEALREFYVEHGVIPSRQAWEKGGHSPSFRTIQRRFGWVEAWRRTTA